MSLKQLMNSAAAGALAVLLVSCGGGGGGSGAMVSGPSLPPASAEATTSGTLTGFGSAIIDGIRVNDHSVLAKLVREDGTLFPTQLKIGQQVSAMHDAAMVASAMHVRPSAEGKVDAVNTAAGTLTVLGQVITVNGGALPGPVTVFEEPYASLADVKVGDLVEVHGIPRLDTATGKSSLQATRIAKATADTSLHTSGLVTNLSTSAKTFSLGALVVDYSQARLLPDGVVLANGQQVHVAVPLGTVASGTPAKATVVRVTTHTEDSRDKPSALGGQVASTNATAKTFTMNGTTVDASAATFPQSGQSFASLTVGSYVVAKGVYDSAGVLKADQVVVRGGGGPQPDGAELHGTVMDFVSMGNFTVRGVGVDASTATIDASCGQITRLANDLQVGVTGTMQPNGILKALKITCEQVQQGQSIIGAAGTVSSVNATASTFVLATGKGDVTVKWTTTTNFVRTDATSLAGKRVVVQGVTQSGVITANLVMATGPQ